MDNKKTLRVIFYLLWVSALLLQSYYVELRGDEAYYWMYSKNLAWGYFDHPPVTALLVKVGYFLFHNELGVRLLFIVLCTATIGVMENMIRPADLKLFYAIILSIGFLQLGMVFGGGMFAIPDFPLLFFTALFYYLYKEYLQNSTWWVVILLAVIICLLMLSKYHGVLVIGFTVLSNPTLLKRKSFWIITGLSLVLFLPHLMWQFAHDFPSVNYHLYERSAKGYSFSYTTEYLFTQPFILGPFVGILLIWLGVTFKPKDLFERSLKFLVIGTYIFFFLMTFKGRVEGNWTIITLVPLLYVGYRHIETNAKLKRISFYSFAVSLLLIVAFRILLITNLFPPFFTPAKSLGARKWAAELKEKSNGKPAAFMNSYQKASLYEFYSGVPAFSLNNFWGRKNQYSIWDTESTFQGDSIVLVANYPQQQHDSIRFSSEYFPYSFINNFRSASNILIQSDLQQPVKLRPLDTLRLTMNVKFRNSNIRDLEANSDYPSRVVYSFFQNSTLMEMRATDIILENDMIGSNQAHSLLITAPAMSGQYDFYLSVGTGWLPPAINSEKIRVFIE